MPHRDSGINRTTYRFGQSRAGRVDRTVQSFLPTASGDYSWEIGLHTNSSAFRILASPDPASDIDRDIFSIRLLSAEQ